MSSTYVRTVLLVPTAMAAQANVLAGVFDPDAGGDDTFGAVLVTVSEQPYFAADTLISESNLSVLLSCLENQFVPLPLRGGLPAAEALNVLNSALISTGKSLQALIEMNGWSITREPE